MIGRATLPTGTGGMPEVRLKLTLLYAHTTPPEYRPLLDLIATAAKQPSFKPSNRYLPAHVGGRGVRHI
ncbi:hypothetical protein GCM10017567_73410 [Amycolatopsis bullii]|uniref:Uncharacterized protein n=1 Tax=Amycolatopsis bullii TaxID=941987 RepID=A0ABQ3KP82_9PSEU|nr:hypothetical protein GCM10017567_73410 [Amycolatopsis bullii]